MDKFSATCDTLNETLSFGDKPTQISGTKINLKLENPILSSYEKLYRNGRIGALYSDRNEICFGAFLQLGKLSLVIAEDLIGQFKGPPLFDKWCKVLERIGTKKDLVSVLDTLEAQMGDFKLEPIEVEHHSNRIKALELELRSYEDSELSCLFVPPNLTEKINKMYSEMFQIPDLPQINVDSQPFPFLPPEFGGTMKPPTRIPTQSGATATQSGATATQSGGTATQFVDKFKLPNSTKDLDLELAFQSLPQNDPIGQTGLEPDVPPFKLNKRFKSHSGTGTGTGTKIVPKTKEQIMNELTDRISNAILSEDTFEFEPQFLNDPLEAMDEVSAFQSQRTITRTPDSTVSKATKGMPDLKYSLATQSLDSKQMECATTLPRPFLSPLRDEDDY